MSSKALNIELILARTKSDTIEFIKNLNLWNIVISFRMIKFYSYYCSEYSNVKVIHSSTYLERILMVIHKNFKF